MAYNDPRFDARTMVPVGFALDFGTATGVGTASNSLGDLAATLPAFIRRTRVTAFKFRCTSIPNAAATVLIAHILNGTLTAGQITLTTATSDQWLTGTMTAANAVFAADVQPTISVIGTATASGGSLGDFDIWFEQQELFLQA